MANPQTQDGYVSIANELFDALCRIRISGECEQVLKVIIRKTYGYGKKEDGVALSTFCLMTGINRPCVVRAISKLSQMNIIVIKKDNAKWNIYAVNKDFDTWKPLSKKITLSKKIMGVIKKDNASLSKKIHSIDNSSITNITKDNRHEEFENFWKLYPNKRNRLSALKAYLKLNTLERAAALDALPKHCQSTEWQKDGGKFIPHASTWLNGKRWEDEINIKSKLLTERKDIIF